MLDKNMELIFMAFLPRHITAPNTNLIQPVG